MCMQRRNAKKKGQSILEYIVLIIFFLGAFLVFQKYIVRGISGRLKGVGDAFGQGRLYDPQKTTECVYDFQYTFRWYDATCFDQMACDCLSTQADTTTCQDCITGCITSVCN